MLVLKCPVCAKKIVWDDFQPTEIRCPGCGENINVHSSLKKNIELRDIGADSKIFYCPKCNERLSRRWFVKCPRCNRLVFGSFSIPSKLPFLLVMIVSYIVFSIYYMMYLH